MNEKILKALMRLFAIITDVREESVSGNARELVSDYLNRQFSKDLAAQYLQLFDEYLSTYHSDYQKSDPEKIKKETALNSVKIYQICEEIRAELQLEPRIVIIIELLEFIKKENVVTNQELEFVTIVAEYFEIDDNEFRNIKAFSLKSYSEIPYKANLLIVDGDEHADYGDIKHVSRSGLTGKIVILHVTSTNTLIFQYNGKQNLYLNGLNIRVNRSYVFAPGSVIRSSKVRPIYYSRVLRYFIQAEVQDRILYKAKDIKFRFPNGSIGVHPFSFKTESGYLVAIMGSSGTGKSTLMNVLNGQLKLEDGVITINGYDLHAESENLEGVIGFVPQEDLLIEEFTVFQNLYYNARLCFRDFTEEHIRELIDESLVNFDLVEARDLKVGTPLTQEISGGQRKRLNLAMELIREPSVLFVDEPTSGLSSMDSEKVMLLLKRQTLKGKLVIVNIHQPSSDIYKLLDRIIIMDQGGKVVFNGNPNDAIIHFNKKANIVNPNESECQLCGNIKTEQPLRIIEARLVDRYGKLIRKRKTTPNEWYSMYLKESEPYRKPESLYKKYPLPRNNFKIPEKLEQFRIFLKRNVHAKLANTQYILISLLEAPLLGLILGYFSKFVKGTANDPGVYIFAENKNIPSFFFMSVIVALFIGLIVSAEEIIKDRKVLKREAFLNLSRGSYLNAKIATLFVLSAIQMFLYIFVAGQVLEINSMLFENWLILFSLAFSANLLGLNISTVMNSIVTVYILIPFILVPQLLLSGVVINFNDLHKNISNPKYVPVVGDLMASRWGFEALMVNQFKNNNYRKPIFEQEVKINSANYEAAFRIPELNKKLEKARRNTLTDTNTQKNRRFLRIIRTELDKYEKFPFMDIEPYAKKDSLNVKAFNFLIYEELSEYLEDLKSRFLSLEERCRDKKDSIISRIIEKKGKDEYLETKRSSSNEAVKMYTQDKLHFEKTRVLKDELIRRKDPVYKYPYHSFGRAHFYAPEKKIGNEYIDTLYFNMLVIWLGTFIFYLFLRIDLLRKLVNSIERLYLKYGKVMLIHRRI